MTTEITSALIELGVIILSSIVTAFILPAISSWLKSKTDNEKIQFVIEDITTTVQSSVDMMEQTVVKQLKADGAWNTESQSDVLQDAVTEIINNLTNKTQQYLKAENSDVNALIIRYIEAYIQSKKQA